MDDGGSQEQKAPSVRVPRLGAAKPEAASHYKQGLFFGANGPIHSCQGARAADRLVDNTRMLRRNL